MSHNRRLKLVDSKSGKDRILLCAMERFGERGFDSVTTRDIATKAHVSVGLINHHYGSKEGLRQAVDEYVIAHSSNDSTKGRPATPETSLRAR